MRVVFQFLRILGGVVGFGALLAGLLLVKEGLVRFFPPRRDRPFALATVFIGLAVGAVGALIMRALW